MSTRKIFIIIASVVALAIVIVAFDQIIETNRAGFSKVKQTAIFGTMTVYQVPGTFWRLFGEVFEYKKADTYFFSKHKDEGGEIDRSVPVRFNDGATAQITGNVRFELPTSDKNILEIHGKFRGYEALVFEGVQQVVSEAVILTAALMTAEESYTTRRADFAELAWDQVANGVYITERYDEQTKDPRTGEITVKTRVKIRKDADNNPVRKANPLKEFNIRLFQFVIKDIDYEKKVEEQIAAKRESLMDVVKAKANAEKAIQDRKTAEEVGKKNVAVAEYEAEVLKKRAVVNAEKVKEVAKLEKEAAKEEKQKQIYLGQGEAERKKLVMQADGALKQKLNAWLGAQQAWAEAYSKRNVPTTVFGGNGDGGSGGHGDVDVQTFMKVMTLNAAQDLKLNLDVKTK
jgi:hypothetical protein